MVCLVTVICIHKKFGVYHAKTVFWRTYMLTVLEVNTSGSSLLALGSDSAKSTRKVTL